MSDVTAVLRRAREIFLSRPRMTLLVSMKDAHGELHWPGPLAELISLVRSHARDSDGETWRIKALDRAIEAAERGDG